MTRGRTRRRRRGLTALAVVFAAVTVAACGGAEAGAPGGTTAPSSTPSATTARTPSLTPPLALPTTGAPTTGAPTTVTPTTVTPTTVTPTTVTPTTVPVAPGTRVGFSLGYAAVDDTDEQLARDFDAIVASGARWIRLDVDWSAIEPLPGALDWSWVDRSVAFAAERGIGVLGLIAYSPYWARPAGATEKHAPDDADAFAAFAGAAAARYAGRVAAWEIWNEPNSALFWQPRPDPARYAELLSLTTAAVRASDPAATVVTGGLAPAVDAADGHEMAPETFLRALVARTSAFDAVGSHPYSYPALPTDASTGEWNSFVRLPLLRQALAEAGLADRPVWITEYGAPTGTSRRAVSEERQAEIVTDAIRLAAGVPWIDKLFLFTHRDSPGPADEPEVHFGLLRIDGAPKPAWDAVTALLRAGG